MRELTKCRTCDRVIIKIDVTNKTDYDPSCCSTCNSNAVANTGISLKEKN